MFVFEEMLIRVLNFESYLQQTFMEERLRRTNGNGK